MILALHGGSDPGEAAGHQLDAGDVKPSHCAFYGCLEILGQASVAVQPGEGAFDHPPPGQEYKALGSIRPFDDLDGPCAEVRQGMPQLVSGVAAISKDMAQPGKSTANARQQTWRAITILHVGRVDGGSNQQSYRVGEDMALAALDHLFGRITARTASLGGLDRLAVDHAGSRACLAACRFAYLHQQHMVDDLPCSVVAPSIEIPLHRRERREIRRQHAPLAASLGSVEDGIDGISLTGLACPPTACRWLQVRFDDRAFGVDGVACIAQSMALI